MAVILDRRPTADEYDPEAADFTSLIAKGAPITPEVVADVWHKWFGDASQEPAPPTSRMLAMAADLRDIERDYAQA